MDLDLKVGEGYIVGDLYPGTISKDGEGYVITYGGISFQILSLHGEAPDNTKVAMRVKEEKKKSCMIVVAPSPRQNKEG